MLKKIFPDFLSEKAFKVYSESDYVVWLNTDEIGPDGYMNFYVSDNQKSEPYYVGHVWDVEVFFMVRDPLIY